MTPQPAPPRSGILIVDDDPMCIAFAQAVLEENGHRVISTTRPEDATDMMIRERPRVVLLDVNMPGKDGLTVLQEFRAASPVPVIMFTASDRAEVAVRSIRLGAFDYVTKPFEAERLLAAVNDALATPIDEHDAHRLGRFELVRELGSGGMGKVYVARDPGLGREVAIKVLQPNLAADEKFEHWFYREARAAATLSHPRIVTVHEAGRHRGRLYLVMERLRGNTLFEILRRKGPLPVPEALRLALQIAEGLAALHAENLVHLDLKPGNIMRMENGNIKILDFGLARSALDAVPESKEVYGTILYMPPELLNGKDPDARADVYGLGMILIELLTGTPVFEGLDDIDVSSKVVAGQTAVKWPDVPEIPGLEHDTLKRLIALDPNQRPASMKEVIRILMMAVQGGSPLPERA